MCPASSVAQVALKLCCTGWLPRQQACSGPFATVYMPLGTPEPDAAQVNPNIRKEKWSEDEDRRLLKLVKQYGNAWAEISRCLDGRTDQQCMGRWRRHLDPSIRRDSWAPQEDQALHELYQQYGSQWSQISLGIPGRTAQQCRARSPPPRPMHAA